MLTEVVEIGDERLGFAICGGRVNGLQVRGDDTGMKSLDVVADGGLGLDIIVINDASSAVISWRRRAIL
jgi:hypothetical protein